MKSPTTLPFSQGRLLITNLTAAWTAEVREAAERRERCMVFSNFHAIDEGRSRKLMASCVDAETAEWIVHACNGHDGLVKDSNDLRDQVQKLRDQLAVANDRLQVCMTERESAERVQKLLVHALKQAKANYAMHGMTMKHMVGAPTRETLTMIDVALAAAGVQ